MPETGTSSTYAHYEHMILYDLTGQLGKQHAMLLSIDDRPTGYMPIKNNAGS